MSRRQRYPWPVAIGTVEAIEAHDRRAANAVQTAASKFAYRKHWVFRTRWDGAAVRVRRAA
jgi:hypothetical protein